jgi:RNA polymerase sigma factor (sigma-70 family)
MPSTRTEDEYAARYSVLYKEHNAQLVAYARSLTGGAAMAEDLAAEAHYRVWRRMRAGHRIDNVAAYLTTTVRNLAAGLARAQHEIARDAAEMPEDPAREGAAVEDPEHRASHVDLISRLLKELPDRWAKALWYAEVEDLPMEEVGAKIGANAGTTAVVLTRARERLRQAFLLSQPGAPLSGECGQYWKHMATVVRGTASARRTRNVTEHCDECDDCRSRMLALTAANTRLPALLGPALLAGVLAGGAWFVPAVAGGVAAGTAAGTAARAGSRAGRHARVGAKARIAGRGLSPTKTVVAGSVAAVAVAATVATLALASSGNPTAAAQSALRPRAAAIQPTSGPATTATATATATAASASATRGAPASASAAATQPPASRRSAAPAAPAGTTAATSAAAAQAAPSAVAQSPQTQAPATAAATPASPAAAAPVSTPATSATTPPVPSSSTPTSAGPVASDTPTPSPSQSSTPAAIPTPSPSETVSDTPSAGPTCTFDIIGLCFATATGGN